MRFVPIAVAALLLATSAFAQGMGGGKGHSKHPKTEQTKKKGTDNTRVDPAVLSRPLPKIDDPWQGVRSDNTSSAPKKPN